MLWSLQVRLWPGGSKFCVLIDVCMHMCVYLQRPEDHARSPGVGVLGGCELPDVLLGTGPRLLQEPLVLLTTEPSF